MTDGLVARLVATVAVMALMYLSGVTLWQMRRTSQEFEARRARSERLHQCRLLAALARDAEPSVRETIWRTLCAEVVLEVLYSNRSEP